MSNDDLFLRIKTLTHAIDTMVSNLQEDALEDIDILSLMLKEYVDEYDNRRKERT